MKASHLVFLVEEPSMEAFLRGLLPRLLPADRTFEVHPFQGKADLLAQLEARLRGYASWLPEDWRIVVVVDRDAEDCLDLKRRMEEAARRAGLCTRTHTGTSTWQLVNRIAIEELEAWYFGDWSGVRAAYPRMPRTIPRRRRFRDPDAIQGGTWEAFERIARRHGYFRAGLPKIEVARTLGQHIAPGTNRSRSFQVFCKAVIEAVV